MPAHAKKNHLSCCRALTRTALSWSVTRGVGVGGVGWGGMITFMFLCTHRHSNLIIFLPVEQRQAQLFHDQLPVGWGELIRFMFLCLHTHSNLIMRCVKELRWSSVSSTKCHTKAALEWVDLCEMSCAMRGVVWDELCELWDELCERTWVKFSARTRKQLHQMPHESSSWVSWVVWDELSEMSCVTCEMRGVVWDELSEMSCVRWVVWLVRWEELCEMKCVHCVRQLEWSWERKKQLRRRRRRQGIRT